jgi:hypothetical protein
MREPKPLPMQQARPDGHEESWAGENYSTRNRVKTYHVAEQFEFRFPEGPGNSRPIKSNPATPIPDTAAGTKPHDITINKKNRKPDAPKNGPTSVAADVRPKSLSPAIAEEING